mgnify:CR=1 FL=1
MLQAERRTRMRRMTPIRQPEMAAPVVPWLACRALSSAVVIPVDRVRADGTEMP